MKEAIGFKNIMEYIKLFALLISLIIGIVAKSPFIIISSVLIALAVMLESTKGCRLKEKSKRLIRLSIGLVFMGVSIIVLSLGAYDNISKSPLFLNIVSMALLLALSIYDTVKWILRKKRDSYHFISFLLLSNLFMDILVGSMISKYSNIYSLACSIIFGTIIVLNELIPLFKRKESKGNNKKAGNGERTPNKIVSIIIYVIVISSLYVMPFIAANIVYGVIFNKTYSIYKPLSYSISEFDDLEVEKHTFKSEDNTLNGYVYSKDFVTPRALVIFAHGLGCGGAEAYMDVINSIVSNGFIVFTYDASGNNGSSGVVDGLPRGAIDLDNAISYAEGLFPDLGVCLIGHSWGAYSAASVLEFHPEVKAAISMSGFDSSTLMMKEEGRGYAGVMSLALMPFVEIHEKAVFGKYANASMTKGIEDSNAKVLIVHSKDDTSVPYSIGYEKLYESLRENDRVKFYSLEDAGHSYVFTSEIARDYIDEFNKEFDEWYGSLEDGEFNAELKARWINENLDRTTWENRMDGELIHMIVSLFYSATSGE